MNSVLFQNTSEEDELKLLKNIFNLEPEKVYHYLELFSKWIKSQKHLQQDTNQICRKKFLIWSKLDLEKAKNKFLAYCYVSLTYKELVSDRMVSPEGDLKCMEYMTAVFTSKLTADNSRVFITLTLDPDRADSLELARYIVLIYDYVLNLEGLTKAYTLIADMQSLKPHHYSKLASVPTFRLIQLSLKAYPFRLDKALVINLHPILEKAINICLAPVPEKIRSRIRILSNSESLLDYLPKGCLPSDYGGTDLPLSEQKTKWTKLLIENKEFLERIGRAKPSGPIPKSLASTETEFGVDGSFRQLNID